MQPTAHEIFNTLGADLRDQYDRLIDTTIEALQADIANLLAFKAAMRSLTTPVIGLPSLPVMARHADEISDDAAHAIASRFAAGPREEPKRETLRDRVIAALDAALFNTARAA